jgi:hypothetical protein
MEEAFDESVSDWVYYASRLIRWSPGKVYPLATNITGSHGERSQTLMRGDRFDLGLQRTPLLIHGDGVIQNGATVNAFPRMEHQKEV